MEENTRTGAQNAVFVKSAPVGLMVAVKGADFDKKNSSLDDILNSFATSGFQATNLGMAIDETNRMLDWTDEDGQKCQIWMSFTSNMISSGLRECFVYLAKHKLVDVIVTTAGGVEEDLIKCLGDTYIGDFALRGKDLRAKGWNRIGNLIVPNENYCKFEDWVQPKLDAMLDDQKQHGVLWTPSKVIERLGREIDNDSSLLYWCSKNNIPIFCPGLTDGSLGDNLFFHTYRNPGLVIDVVADIRRINDLAVHSPSSGLIVLGGGLAKHHICNANLMRNGADFAVYVNTGAEFDGCDSGARPDEAVSWGKIKATATPVKVVVDATIAFPLIMAGSFCKQVNEPAKYTPK